MVLPDQLGVPRCSVEIARHPQGRRRDERRPCSRPRAARSRRRRTRARRASRSCKIDARQLLKRHAPPPHRAASIEPLRATAAPARPDDETCARIGSRRPWPKHPTGGYGPTTPDSNRSRSRRCSTTSRRCSQGRDRSGRRHAHRRASPPPLRARRHSTPEAPDAQAASADLGSQVTEPWPRAASGADRYHAYGAMLYGGIPVADSARSWRHGHAGSAPGSAQAIETMGAKCK